MKDVMGVIYTSKNDLTLRDLTLSRAVAALPVAGRYRMIDFMLSNMVNSGIRNVGVIVQKNYHSLMDHLGSGKEWDLHTRNEGLFILPPFMTRENVGSYGGILDALRSNMAYLRRSNQEYLILTNSHTAMNTTFDDLVRFHQGNGADITLVYTKKRLAAADRAATLSQQRVFMNVDADGLVKEMEIGRLYAQHENLYMDIMLIKRVLLIQLLDIAFAQGYHDLNRDIFQRFVANQQLRVAGYEFKDYSMRVETINSFYQLNMDLLHAQVRHALFAVNPVYTKVRDEVPARYTDSAMAMHSLVADGCVIEGRVEHSVLFRGVHVGKGSVVRNSILMQEDDIQENVELENVILDKRVTVRRNNRLIAPAGHPFVLGKGTTI